MPHPNAIRHLRRQGYTPEQIQAARLFAARTQRCFRYLERSLRPILDPVMAVLAEAWESQDMRERIEALTQGGTEG